MTTTSLGIPLVNFDTDQPNGAGQINAVAEAVDALITARLLPAARHLTGHAMMTGLSSGSNPVGGPWTTAYSVGGISYGSGIFTVARAGLYVWSATATRGSPAGGSVTLMAYVNGAAPANVNGATDVVAGSFTAGGPIHLNAGDQVQLNLFVTGSATGFSITPNTYGLHLVG